MPFAAYTVLASYSDLNCIQHLQLTLGELLLWLRDNLLTERPELFLQGSTV